MPAILKMITESNWDVTINESEDKKLYIMGIFSSAETKNKNGRTYPKSLLEREVVKLKETAIKQRTCLGQMGHPEDSPETDLEKASIIIEDLEWKNNDVMGRARVLNTPSGKILRTLIEDKVQVGISSRGLGTINENGTVNEDYSLLTYDIVSNPSNKGSFVNGILEGKEFTVHDIEDLKTPTEEDLKEALAYHEKRIWQVLKDLRG